eukprot:352834-Chlamydomonas_euryale.AAC.11
MASWEDDMGCRHLVRTSRFGMTMAAPHGCIARRAEAAGNGAVLNKQQETSGDDSQQNDAAFVVGDSAEADGATALTKLASCK